MAGVNIDAEGPCQDGGTLSSFLPTASSPSIPPSYLEGVHGSAHPPRPSPIPSRTLMDWIQVLGPGYMLMS